VLKHLENNSEYYCIRKKSTRSEVKFNVEIYYEILGRGLKILGRGQAPSPDPTPNENNGDLKVLKTRIFKATRCIHPLCACTIQQNA